MRRFSLERVRDNPERGCRRSCVAICVTQDFIKKPTQKYMETNTTEIKKPFYKKKWFVILAVILVIGALAGDSTPNNQTAINTNVESKESALEPRVEETVLEVTATKMIADYKANEIAADGTYKDKLVKVTGVVGTIGKDVLNNPYVTLTNETPYGLEAVQCFFSRADESTLTNLSKDTRITMQGRVSGMSLTNVMIKECTVVN